MSWRIGRSGASSAGEAVERRELHQRERGVVEGRVLTDPLLSARLRQLDEPVL